MYQWYLLGTGTRYCSTVLTADWYWYELVPPMQLRALWFTKSLQLDSHCLPKFRTQVPGVYLGWVFS
eukprot:COSAG05_NODE_11_length_38500_cov_831.349861_45_plen_67_part_00